jgi:hypothetical protein
MDAAFRFLSIQRDRPVLTFDAPAPVWRPGYRLDRYYSQLYSGIGKLDTFKRHITFYISLPFHLHADTLRPALLPLMSSDQLRYFSD